MEEPKNEVCQCEVCKRSREFKKHLESVSTEEARNFFSSLLDRLLQTEEDLQYAEAITIPRLYERVKRKDEALKIARWFIGDGELEARLNGWCRTSVVEKMENALSTEEVSDG